jgi:hypothetical protein
VARTGRAGNDTQQGTDRELGPQLEPGPQFLASPRVHADLAAAAVRTVASGAHDRDDLLDLGRIGRIPQSLVVRRTAGMESRHRRRRATSAGAIE